MKKGFHREVFEFNHLNANLIKGLFDKVYRRYGNVLCHKDMVIKSIDPSKSNCLKVLETFVSLVKPIDLCSGCWMLPYRMKHDKFRFAVWRNLPNILSMDAFEGRVQLKIENWRLSRSGISFLPPPGWIMAAMNWMSTMCVNSPGFSRL